LEKVFFEGPSKECRDRVKTLNELKHVRELEKEDYILNQLENPAHFVPSTITTNEVSKTKSVSMWDRFLSDKDREEMLQYSRPKESDDEN
jgi:hypothetical protein